MTKTERQAIRAEYAEMFGQCCLDLALRLRKTIKWMHDAILSERRSRARCQAIRDQVVKFNPNLSRFVND